jgi:hypothetical protein
MILVRTNHPCLRVGHHSWCKGRRQRRQRPDSGQRHWHKGCGGRRRCKGGGGEGIVGAKKDVWGVGALWGAAGRE